MDIAAQLNTTVQQLTAQLAVAQQVVTNLTAALTAAQAAAAAAAGTPATPSAPIPSAT